MESLVWSRHEAMASPQSHPSSSLHIGEVFDGLLHNAPAHLGVGTADVKPTILRLSQSHRNQQTNKMPRHNMHATMMCSWRLVPGKWSSHHVSMLLLKLKRKSGHFLMMTMISKYYTLNYVTSTSIMSHTLYYPKNPREQTFVVQISLLIVTFLSLILWNLSLMQTTKEVNPHPCIVPCVNMWSVTLLSYFSPLYYEICH